MSSTPGQLEWTSPSSGSSFWTDVDTNNDGNIDGIQTSTNSYNVGIGTSPSTSIYKLSVNGSTAIEGDLYVNDDVSGYDGNIIAAGNITAGLNLTAGGEVTFSLDTVANNATGTVAMVVSDNLGRLNLMDMSNMGSHWSSDASGNPYVQNKNVGIGTTPSSTMRLKVSGNTVIENSNDAKLYLTPGSNKWAEIWMGHSGATIKGLIKYQNDDHSMHFWAGNTPILKLTDQSVEIPELKTLENHGYLVVHNNSTFNKNVNINGGDMTIQTLQGLGGNLEIDGNIKITGNSHTSGAVLTSDGSGNATWQQPAGSGGSNSKTFNYLSDGF